MKEFLWPVRVYYEDTDSGGVVYYANYLRFMERARTEWLRSQGFEQDRLLEQEGVLFAVRKAALDFRRPARFNDELLVSVRIEKQGKASMTFQQTVTRRVDGELLCQGEVQVACIDAEHFLPCPIPQAVIKGISDGI